MRTVEVYRLWGNGTWDKVPVTIEYDGDNDDVIESRAVTAEWIRLSLCNSQKPLQVGLYMHSIYGAKNEHE